MRDDSDVYCKPIDASTVAALMPKITPQLEPVGECLEWRGPTNGSGYGMISLYKFGNFRVHRVAYVAAMGEIPPGLVIDHLCRNRRCCNAQHMEVVSGAENGRRKANPICGRGHLMVGDNKYTDRRGRYHCRECMKLGERRRWDNRWAEGRMTEGQRKFLVESEPDDIDGTEGCGVELWTSAHYAIARSLAKQGFGRVFGPGQPKGMPGLYFNNTEGLQLRQTLLNEESQTNGS